MMDHYFEIGELDCAGVPMYGEQIVHKFCVKCGMCAQSNCSIFAGHSLETLGTYTPLPLPTSPRGGHPRFYELVKDITDLHDRKNKDYAGGTKEGPLGNFVRVSKIMQLYPGFDWDSDFGVAMVYMLKQLDAAFTLRSQKRESVTGEPVQARLKDITVYSLIGQILVEEEQSGGQDS